jgi:cytochrome b6-f complex iron-sulfur subunit
VTSHTPTRREFCAQACGIVGVAALGGALQACGAGGPGSPSAVPALPTVTAAPGNGVVTLAIDSSSPLAMVGSAALVRSASNVFLVARTAQDSFSALTPICTHEACTITGFDSQNYVCPCHGSRFDTSGRVTNGPAARSLRAYQTRFAGDVLTITL